MSALLVASVLAKAYQRAVVGGVISPENLSF